ncbi:MAG: amidohydrolase family protein [Deltaproteobacteria bacterium]|jgi:predicted TIM-barrel fold metal-dependent hydrolase|nr:amidohydrolase family protein [Deltaproteobacteria bacterium]
MLFLNKTLTELTGLPKIDAHAHVGHFGSWCGVSITAQEMVSLMPEYGIEKTVISFPDNEVTLAAQRAYPDKLLALAWLNPAEGRTALDRFSELSDQKLISGLKLHPLFNAYTADDECVFPFMELAVKKDLPVFIHSGHPPFSLPWSIGLLAERYPLARIVMVHMGHGHGVYIQAALEVAQRRDNIWLENSGMPMHTKIKEAYQKVGAERLFWGSDAPFHHYSVEILRTLVSGLSHKELTDVFYLNIKKFLEIQE